MARVSEIKVTIKDKSIFDKNEQSLEVTIDTDKEYPYCYIKTERWDMLDEKGFENIIDSIFKRFLDAYFLSEDEIK